MSRESLEGFGPDGRLRAIREAREDRPGDPFASMAGQLFARPQPTPPAAHNDGITERLRDAMRKNPQCTARELAEAVGLADSGKVSGILKKDRQAGRVLIVDGRYSWNDLAPVPPCGGRARVRDILDWHEVADGDFPDADLTVIVRTRGCEEPVWLGFWDGEEWRDSEGQPIDVIRWTDMPKGGDE